MTGPSGAARDSGLDDEDRKLVVLARGALGRTQSGAGAAVRDTDGRTYAAGEVSLAALQLTALQAAIAAALSSGAEGFEAAAVVGSAAETDPGIAALHELSSGATRILARPDGTVTEVHRHG
ncbi:cytidine deaminase [Skermania piniformis]|uniref:Cytidine deaminase n=1 Tax=Skermania pinensis TaxID=39122 RepID=A0ABX8SEV6_9ACTN|nr:cytidine deaminase [Skermania piniformis]QXQ14955.1 cytidine deaminase [Skermania piniformis]